jgi:hypothetical protein
MSETSARWYAPLRPIAGQAFCTLMLRPITDAKKRKPMLTNSIP